MSNLRDRQIYQKRSIARNSSPSQIPRSDRNQVYQQSLVNQTPKAANGQPNSQASLDYRDGYVHGKTHEQYVKADLKERDNENAARGMLFGIVFASLASAVIAALFIVNQAPPSVPVAPVAAPVSPQNPGVIPSPQTNNTQVRERIIERTQEVVPIPQPPAVSTPQQGTVNSAPTGQPALPSPTQTQGQVSQPQTQTQNNPSIQRTQTQGPSSAQGLGAPVTPNQETGNQDAGVSPSTQTNGGSAGTSSSTSTQ